MPRPRADGKKNVLRTRGEVLSEHLSGSARTFTDLPANVAQELLRRIDPIEYNLLRAGNWTIDKLRKQVIQLLDPRGNSSVLPTHHVGSLLKACLSEFIRRYPHRASAVDMEMPEVAQAKAVNVKVKTVTKGKNGNQTKKAKNKGAARLGFCIALVSMHARYMRITCSANMWFYLKPALQPQAVVAKLRLATVGKWWSLWVFCAAAYGHVIHTGLCMHESHTAAAWASILDETVQTALVLLPDM